MNKLIPIILIVFSYSMSNDTLTISSEWNVINFINLSNKEKLDTLLFIQNQYDESRISFSKYTIEVQNIINVDGDSLTVELVDHWWWNNPQRPVEISRFHSGKILNQKEPSLRETFFINEIIAIKVIQQKSPMVRFLPVFLIILFMKAFGLF